MQNAVSTETYGVLEGSGQPSASSALGAISFYGLLAVILLSAIPYGAVETWHKSLLIVLVMVLAGLRIVDNALHRAFKVTHWTLLLPLVGILALAFVQVVQWPEVSGPISADPYETKSFILIFGALMAAAEILFNYTNSRRRLICLIVLVLFVGLASSIFGLLREMVLDSQSGYLAGYFPHEQGFAQFINRNHFAVLVEMSFGLLLGILIKGDLSEKFKFLFWLIASVMAYSLIMASSRGGLISMAALGLFAISVHVMTRENKGDDNQANSRRTPRSSGMLVKRILLTACFLTVVLGLVVFTIAFVGGDTLVTRFEKLPGEFEAVNSAGINRNQIWNSTLGMIQAAPFLGIGFGAYGSAITKFDTSNGKHSLKQAHNDYLETLANGGILGFGLFGAFGVLVARKIAINLRSRDPLLQSACFGAAAGIFGVLIHSFVDFGLHVPANALIFIVLVVVATANIRAPWMGTPDEPGLDSRFRRLYE